MAAELPRPGVEVIQVFRSVSPTIVTPTLVPCVVGVCKQIVDVLTTTSSGSQALNNQALVSLPGFFLAAPGSGTPAKYSGLDGLHLDLSIDNGPAVVITFSDPTVGGLTPTTIVSQIDDAFELQSVTAALAEVVGTDRFRVRTVGVGEFESVKVLAASSASVLTAFGLAADQEFIGLTSYNQYQVNVPQTNFPDPRSNLEQLSIQDETIRAFLALGSGAALKELLRTESFLRNGGDPTPATLLGTADLTAVSYATAGVVAGTADVTSGALYGGGGTLNGLTLIMTVNGVGPTTLTLNGATNAANQAALLAAIGTTFPDITATVGGSGGNKLLLTNELPGAAPRTITISGSSTALTALGLSAGSTSGVAGALDGAAVTFAVNDGSNLVATFSTPPVNAAAIAAVFAAVLGALGTASVSISPDPLNRLKLVTTAEGAAASIRIVSGTLGSLTTLGFTASQTVTGVSGVAAIDDGNGDALTPLLSVVGQNFTTSGTAAVMTGTADITAGGLYGGGGTLNGKTLTLSDGRTPQTITFSAPADAPALLVALNAFFGVAAGGRLAFTQGGSGGNKLVITHTQLGAESLVRVNGVGTSASGDAAVLLGLIPVSTAYPTATRGGPFPPLAGDEVYVDGVFVGKISQVAPGGVVSLLKIDKQIPIDADLGMTFYIVAKNLTGAQTSTRPSADLVVDPNGTPFMKHEVLRDTQGNVILTSRAAIYIQYTAVREDVTALARNPGLLRFSNTSAIDSALSPISAANPLALGLFFSQLNAPGIEITGLGVDAISADSPFGTVEAFTRAAEFLEGFEVYGIAPLTHDPTVAQVFNTHVTVMSSPANKGERVVLFNPSQPTSRLDTLVASGLTGQSSGGGGIQFDTGVNNLSALLLNADISPIGTIPVSAGVFLDIATDAKKYSVSGVSGSVVTIRTSFASGENDDAYYSTTALPSPLIDEAFAIRIRGTALVTVDGAPDKSGIAATYQGLGQTFLNRRFWQIIPDRCAATIGGLEQVIDGFYLCAAIVGMIGQQPPQQSFTNFPMTGFTKVMGSQDFFSERQLNVIAAGGNYVVVQDTPGAPIASRMALTTDMTSIETRTDSVNKVVDFSAKFLRRGLKNFIGRFNITQGFLDSLGHVIQGLLDFLVQTGVLIGATLNNIVQDEDAPDTVLIDITLDVPFPCNYIRLTLVI
jgi:hypothetical protein